MNGITDLQQLLNSLAPRLLSGEWAFCTPTPAQLDATPRLADEALSTFRESEGLSLLLPIERAIELELSFDGSFTGITLDVHSSLHAIGLTAVVATRLGESGISANVIAAAFHDNVFVQTADAARALDILNSLHG